MMKVFNQAMLVFLLSAAGASAQEPQMIDINDPTHVVRQGKIFTVRMVPGDKTTSFFVAGNKAADVKFDKLSAKATLYGPKGRAREIELARREDRFEYQGTLTGERLEIQLQQPDPALKEKLELRLRQNP